MLRRLTGFAGLQVVAVLSPVLVLPALTAQIGTSGWVAFSIGYGLGGVANIFTLLGWNIAGPALVASAAKQDQQARLIEASWVRLGAFLVSSAIVTVLCWLLVTPDWRLLAILIGVAVNSWGLSQSWLYIGLGKPSGVLWYETLPRLLASLLSVVLFPVTDPIIYPALLLLAAVIGFLGPLVTFSRSMRFRKCEISLPRLRSGVSLGSTGVMASAMNVAVVPLAGLAGADEPSLAMLAAGMRIRSWGYAAIIALISALQGWVAEPKDRASSLRRQRIATTSIVLCGGLVGLALLFLAPLMEKFVFSSVVSLDMWFIIVISFSVVVISLGNALSNLMLAPRGQVGVVSVARVISSLACVGLTIWFVGNWGGVAAAVAALIAEMVLVGLMVGWLLKSTFRRFLRRPR